MVGHTYISDAVPTRSVLQLIDDAQNTLNRHAADLNGLCLTCRVASPCAHRESAVQIFFRYFRLSLPQRQPVTTAVPAAPVAWFAPKR